MGFDIDLVSFSVITAPRSEPHLENTIRSLQETDFFSYSRVQPLRIVAGNPDDSYLQSYRAYPNKFFVDSMPTEEAKRTLWYEAGLALKATMGHRRCLDPSRVRPGTKYLCVMEDDIRFCKGWMPRFNTILGKAIAEFGDRFLLSLYTPGSTAPLAAYRGGLPWVPRIHKDFYGIQAVVYPFSVRDEFVERTNVKPTLLPHDLSLGVVCADMKVPILSSAPCLVQHMGKHSGADSPWHDSRSWLEDISLPPTIVQPQKKPGFWTRLFRKLF